VLQWEWCSFCLWLCTEHGFGFSSALMKYYYYYYFCFCSTSLLFKNHSRLSRSQKQTLSKLWGILVTTDSQARISRNMRQASSASSSLSSNFFNSGNLIGSVECLQSSSCCRRLPDNCFDNVLFGGGLTVTSIYTHATYRQTHASQLTHHTLMTWLLVHVLLNFQ